MDTILNLKRLSRHVTHEHFKMESLSDVFKIIQVNCWMVSVDLKDAFYSIPIHNAYQRYFKFMWFQKFHKYLWMPNGYSDEMRVFTKMWKPQFVTLRKTVSLLSSLVFNGGFRTDTVYRVLRFYYKLRRHDC